MGLLAGLLSLDALVGRRLWWCRVRLALFATSFLLDFLLAHRLRLASGFALLAAFVYLCGFRFRHTALVTRLQKLVCRDFSVHGHGTVGIGTIPLVAGHAAGLGHGLSVLLVVLYSIIVASAFLPGFLSLFSPEPGEQQRLLVRILAPFLSKETLKVLMADMATIQRRVQDHPKIWLFFHGLAFGLLVLVLLHGFIETFYGGFTR